jgi:protease stability complex PrcB-like protein
MRVFLLIAIIVLVSCKPSETVSPVVLESQAIAFVELNSGTNGDFPEKSNKVISNQTDYNDAWGAAFSRFFDKQKPARIDFENKMILLVTMGEKTSGGYTIKIDSIKEDEKTLVVTILETSPGKGCMNTSVMTYPYQIIELKKSKKEVVFKTIEKIYNCGK